MRIQNIFCFVLLSSCWASSKVKLHQNVYCKYVCSSDFYKCLHSLIILDETIVCYRTKWQCTDKCDNNYKTKIDATEGRYPDLEKETRNDYL